MGYKIAFIGSGNVASNLAHAMDKAGHTILQIISSREDHAKLLASQFGAYYGTDIAKLDDHADFVIIGVNDEAYYSVLENIPPDISSIVCHSAGPVSMDILSKYAKNYGVLYPLQSLRKEEIINFNSLPLFIEANSLRNLDALSNLADSISNVVKEVSSEEREKYHLAAVFANNFTNLMYTIADEYLQNQSLDFNYLLPIINETANRLKYDKPKNWQTGPAKRGDISIIQKHIDMLDDTQLKTIYKQLSDLIGSR